MNHKPLNKNLLAIAATCTLIISSAYLYKADKVIQVDISGILNTRSVTTLTNGKLVPWTNGVDRENGYLTMAAALYNGETKPKAIADDPLIPANEHHPAILLHYSNKEAVKYQTKLLANTNAVIIKVPKNKYSDLYVCLTSAYGASKLQYDLIYSDGTAIKTVTVPDWAYDVQANDPDFSYVVHDLAKWTNKSKLTETEHHNIHALNMHPDAARTLTAIKIKDLSATYMLLWAVTGVVK